MLETLPKLRSIRPLTWVQVAVVLAFALFAYSNIFSNQFLLDDEFLLQKNQLLNSWSTFFDIFRLSSTGGAGGVDSFYRPMQTVMYLIFAQLFGFSVETFHALNLFLHLLNVLLIAILGLRLGFRQTTVFLLSLIWAVHPIHTEAVTYMSATADPLHTLFCLLGLCYLAPDFTFRKILRVLPIYILGILSKEPAIVFPALVVAVYFLKNPRPYDWRGYVRTWPLWVTAVLYLVLRQTILNFDRTFQFYQQSNIYTENIHYRIFTFFATIPNYLRLLIWPENLHLERSFSVYAGLFDVEPLMGLAFCLLVLAAALWERRREHKLLTFAGLWMLAAHVTQSGILVPVNSFFLEHWMYMVSIVPMMVLIEVAVSRFRTASWRLGFVTVMIGVAGLFAWKTYEQNRTWSDPITFYNYILSVEPKPATRIFNNLGMAYSDLGDFKGAEQNYLRAIESSDEYPQTRHNLALVLMQQQRVDEALPHLERAIQLNPDFYHSYKFMAEIYRLRNQPAMRDEYLRKFEETRAKFGP